MTILVTYASRSQSTAEIATKIGNTLQQQGVSVEVRSMSDVHDLSDYDAIVVGSAIRRQNWLPEAMHFMEVHQETLRQKPVAAFLVCIALATDKPARAQRTASAWMQPARNLVSPVSEGYFAGVLDIRKIPERPYRILFRLIVALGLFKEGDFRDWQQIRGWAQALPDQLLTLHEPIVNKIKHIPQEVSI